MSNTSDRSLQTTAVPLSSGKGVLYLRPGTTDIDVYREIFVDQEHVIELPQSPETIIDAGANIGLSAVDFALRYPQARIIAIEPEMENFQLLRKNIASFQNIIPLQAALWSQETTLALVDPGAGAWGFQTVATAPAAERIQTVRAITIEAIKATFQITRIDLLKLDIEGAEKEVFENSSSWLPAVRALILELHDEIRAGCEAAFRSAMRDFDCEGKGRGGKIVCRRKESVAGAP
jgi:FkbM family methyltransferase